MKLVKKAVLSIAVFFALFALFSLAAPAATTWCLRATKAQTPVSYGKRQKALTVIS